MRIRRTRRKGGSPETGWGSARNQGTGILCWWICGLALLFAFFGWAVWYSGNRNQAIRPSMPDVVVDGMESSLEDAEKIARAFLAETDPTKRLQWVCDAQEVSLRMRQYSKEALQEVGEIRKVLGHRVEGDYTLTGFVVGFPSGSMRLLEVFRTPEGPKIDWDAYARHGTATWEDLLSGKARHAVVRVFCEPATERVEPFADQSRWTCFRMSSQDLPQAVLAYSGVGSLREVRMKEAVLGVPKFRQRFTLEIVRHDEGEEPVFEITRCLAVGWVVMGDLESKWREIQKVGAER